MINYKLWSETEDILTGDIRIFDNELWEAIENISRTTERDMSNIPTFNSSWKKSTNIKYINVKYINHFIEIKIDTSVDDITFTLPDPSLKNKKDVHVILDTSGNTLTVETHDVATLINKSINSMDLKASSDSIVYHPSSDTNWQVRSEVADMPPLVFCCRPSNIQSYTSTRTNIEYDIIVMDKGNIAHISTGEIIFDKAGIYNITVSFGARATSSTRVESSTYLQIDSGSGFIDSQDILLNGYHRQTAQGASGDSQTIPLEVSAGHRIRVQTVGTGGALETIPASCTINITVSKGIRGEKGEKGDQGFDGANGDITWEGTWSAGTYQRNMEVEYNGSSFICIQNGTSVNPGTPDTPNIGWELSARKGSDGAGATINISENGAMVTNTPHGTLNFINGAKISDAGSGIVNITIVNIQPYLAGNDDIVLFNSVTGEIFLSGDNFDNNISIDLGSAVTIDTITALSPDNIRVNYSTSSVLQTNIPVVVSRNGISSFGQNINCTVTDTITGTGSSGTWVENFNTGGWSTPRWTIFEGSSLNNLFSTGTSTPSSNTGATAGYDGDFLYTERSNPNFGTGTNYDAYVETTDFRSLTQIRFMLHKWSNNASNMGDLVIYSRNANNSLTERWRHTGNEQSAQADPFVQITLDTTGWDCKGIRIFFEAANSYMSDICIDNIEITSI